MAHCDIYSALADRCYNFTLSHDLQLQLYPIYMYSIHLAHSLWFKWLSMPQSTHGASLSESYSNTSGEQANHRLACFASSNTSVPANVYIFNPYLHLPPSLVVCSWKPAAPGPGWSWSAWRRPVGRPLDSPEDQSVERTLNTRLFVRCKQNKAGLYPAAKLGDLNFTLAVLFRWVASS